MSDWARKLAQMVIGNDRGGVESMPGSVGRNRALGLVGQRGPDKTVEGRSKEKYTVSGDVGEDFFARRRKLGFPEMPEGNREKYLARMIGGAEGSGKTRSDVPRSLEDLALQSKALGKFASSSAPMPTPQAAPAVAEDEGTEQRFEGPSSFIERNKKDPTVKPFRFKKGTR